MRDARHEVAIIGGVVNPELEALLVVQADDAVIREIEGRLAALMPRMARLDALQQRAAEEVARAEASLEREVAKQRALDARIAEHRERHDKNVEILNQAQKLRDATAAASQVESARRALADEESEALSVSRRVLDLRTALTAHREVLEQMSTEQAEARRTLGAERAVIDTELQAALKTRAVSSAKVSPGLLSKYERVSQRRRKDVVIELRDFCCSACDTAIPLQRKVPMSSGMYIEPCEACGVLLYYRAAPVEQPS